jgi:hypothetical protein
LYIEREQPYQPRFAGIPHILTAIFTLILTTLLTLRKEWCTVLSIGQQPSSKESNNIPKK